MLHLGGAKLAKSYFANEKKIHKFSSEMTQIAAIHLDSRNSAALYPE